MQSLKILIVDDHEVIRRALRSLLSSRPEWLICGEAANGREGIRKARDLRPDLILMDLTMPEMGGIEATRLIRHELPEIKVIVISQNEPEISRALANANGAIEFVAKADLSRDLLKVIEEKCLDQASVPSVTPQGQESDGLDGKDIPNWLSGGGEMGSAMRLKDWHRTPLGPLEAWPQALKVSAGICISSRFDLIVWWGPELTMLYNDSYRRTLGAKHPQALGSPGRTVYPEIWDVIGPMLDHVMTTGEATWSEDLLLLLERNGYPEETYHTFSYTPVRNDAGKVLGVITPVSETTDKVISERRLMTLRDLAAKSVDAKSESEAWEFAARALDGNPYDIPFAVLYRLEDDAHSVSAVAWSGIKMDNPFLFPTVQLKEQNLLANLLAAAERSGQPVRFDRLDEFGISLPGGFWGISPAELYFLPITQMGQERPMGILAAGVSRHKRLDDSYRGFFELVVGQIARSIADVRLLDEERKRAATLRQTLGEAEAQAALLDLSNDAAFISDSENCISYWNRGAERLYGWTQKEVRGLNASALLQTEFPVPFVDVVRALEREGRWEGELQHTTRYGLRMTVSSRWTSRKNAQGAIIGWLEVNSDTTPQKRAEEVAHRLSARILQLQDQERRKLARELHDSLGQYLAALKINGAGCLRHAHDPKIKAILTDSLEIIEQCISEIRTMSYLLHPPLLDESGLVSAIQWLAEGFGKRSGILVNLVVPTNMPRFSQDIETAIFRILQESLLNAHRHSGTAKVDIEIRAETHTVLLTVRDYGCGISEKQLASLRHSENSMSVGFGGMRERARELGGTLLIRPESKGGTIISLEIPIGGNIYATASPRPLTKTAEAANSH